MKQEESAVKAFKWENGKQIPKPSKWRLFGVLSVWLITYTV
jgi:hypothetical protein